MTNIDQFESVFKAAAKTPFSHEAVSIRSALVVTDAQDAEAAEFAQRVQAFFSELESGGDVAWSIAGGDRFSSVATLMQVLDEVRPELICVHRNLFFPAAEYPYSLGVFVDVLTQATAVPIALLPHPQWLRQNPQTMTAARSIMAITDHLTGDHHLVSVAAHVTPPGGKLVLTHVEDEATFERYLATISRIPSIDTEDARASILQQLLKEPHDYIRSCREVLQAAGEKFEIEEVVSVGHRVRDHKRLIAEHQADLLVLNTKDHDQLAMHGVAYPLTVELRDTPMLLL